MNNMIEREKWYIRWYQYNKYSIPVIFTVIGTMIFTLFLDFRSETINFQSHISAILLLTNQMIGFYLFLIYIIAIIQLFNSIAFAKKRSPVSLFLFTILNILQVFIVYLYINVFYNEVKIRTDHFVIPPYGIFSMNIMIAGSLFFIIATIFAWFYVDWKYVKIEE